MKLEEISLNEYEEFINSLGIKNTLIRMNNRSYIGIKENDKIIGVDMIGTAKRKTFGKYAYYSAIGPIFNKDRRCSTRRRASRRCPRCCGGSGLP